MTFSWSHDLQLVTTVSGPGIPAMSVCVRTKHHTTTTYTTLWAVPDTASSYAHTHYKGNICLLPVTSLYVHLSRLFTFTCHSMSTCQGYLLSHVTLCPLVKAIYCRMSLYVHLLRLFTVTCHSMSTCQGYLLSHVSLCPPVKAIYCHMSLYVHLSRLFTVTRHLVHSTLMPVLSLPPAHGPVCQRTVRER